MLRAIPSIVKRVYRRWINIGYTFRSVQQQQTINWSIVRLGSEIITMIESRVTCIQALRLKITGQEYKSHYVAILHREAILQFVLWIMDSSIFEVTLFQILFWINIIFDFAINSRSVNNFCENRKIFSNDMMCLSFEIINKYNDLFFEIIFRMMTWRISYCFFFLHHICYYFFRQNFLTNHKLMLKSKEI